MNQSLLIIGLGKVVFGLLVGALGVLLASRVLGRLLKAGDAYSAVRQGNLAIGVLNAFGLVSLGVLAQHAVEATFAAMDLLYRGKTPDTAMLGRFALYGTMHAGFSLIVGAGVLGLGAWIFGRMTKEVDEIEEIKRGNIAAAFVLGSVMLVLALMTAPGLQTALDGLLPMPALDPGEFIMPS